MLRKALDSFLVGIMFLLASTPAWATENIHASGYLRPFILICVVLIFAAVIIWALRYWAADIPAPLGKVVHFAVIFVALIIILFILLGMVGIHIT
jgi:sterol desaturase/sphingolipid hydroxylase (fatty acid hydroxylase superfamily)